MVVVTFQPTRFPKVDSCNQSHYKSLSTVAVL